MLRTYDKMMLELAEAEKVSTVIKIQACHSIADYALPCTLIKANGVFPSHNYELSASLSADIVYNVTNSICDVGFSCEAGIRADSPDVVSIKVGVNNIVLVSSNDDSFPDATTAEALLDSCLITFTEKNNINSALNKNLKKLGYDQNSLNCNLRVEGIESAKMLVSKKFGIAFVPYISVKEELYKKQLKTIAVPEFNMDLDITMLYRQDCPGHVRDFVDWLKKNGSKSFC